MTTKIDGGRPFTGKHMIMIMVAFFGVIISVNFLMAYYANTTWSGLVVKNSYVASQEFNGKVEDVKAQEALGWKGRLASGNGNLAWTLNDKSGAPVATQSVTVLLRRPVTDKSDATITLSPGTDGIWTSDHKIEDGLWIAIVDAATRDNGNWRETVRFSVVNGEIR